MSAMSDRRRHAATSPTTSPRRAPRARCASSGATSAPTTARWPGSSFVIAVLLMAVFANVLAPYPPDLTNNAVFLKPPAWQAGGSWAYPLGTDAIGRDMLSRLIHGARLSLLIGIAVVALAIVVGIALGLVAGFFRGVTEIAIMRLMDIILTLPSLLLAIVIVAILGPGLMNAMLAVVVVVLPHYVRITRAAVITEASKDYVTAARANGAAALAPDVPRGAAELRGAADRAGVARRLDRDPRRRRARLPRPGRAAAGRRSGARCSPTRASSCCARGGW